MATTKKAAAKFVKLAPTKAVVVTLPPKVNAKTIHATLDEIFKLNGCIACGLGGIDLRLRLGDIIQPRINEGIAQITSF
jgi:hypothetical protein